MKPDKDDVRDVFEELLSDNGQTTSKEIKLKLRSMGYWATQEDVSPMVREIASEDNISFSFNGNYRVYSKTPVVTSNVSVSKLKPVKPVLTDADRELIYNTQKGDWECTEFGDDPYYFSGKMTEGQAKSCYAKYQNVNYLDVRARRVK
jgi:hypothetical protein